MNTAQAYTRLEHRLILLAWLDSLFGCENHNDLLTDCKDVADGYGANDHSYLYQHLRVRSSDCKPYSVVLIDAPGRTTAPLHRPPLTRVSPEEALPDTPSPCCQPETED